MGRLIMYSPEVRERAVRMVSELSNKVKGASLWVGGDLFGSFEVWLLV